MDRGREKMFGKSMKRAWIDVKIADFFVRICILCRVFFVQC